jgi:hypothetical protein
VLLDGRWPDILRRKAMIARLTAFAFEGAQTLDSNVALRLANQLSQLQLYNVLSPLEHLYDIGNGAMKSAVLVGMKTLFFKRTFTTVQKALREPNGALTRDAAAVIEGLFFQHAQGPLTRIARESSVQEVRTAALRALARVDTTEAAEFLVGILDHGSQADCEAATTALKEARGPKFLDVARVALGFSTPQTAQRLRDILRRRGAIK